MIQIDEVEARILGSLVEKSLTTPDLYPLTLNGLINACNQKTSRDPVMNLEEPAVARGLHALIEKGLAGRIHEPGSRVPKFMHHIEFLLDKSDSKIVAAVCLLLLRGPQTPGEIKSRSDRLHPFASTSEVESLLQDLASRPEPYVRQLPRQPGQKETRYRHLFCADTTPGPIPTPATREDDRLSRLERKVEALEILVAEMNAERGSGTKAA